MTATTTPRAGHAATSADEATPRPAGRRRVVRRVVGGLVLLGLLALTAVLPEPRTTQDPLAPDSVADNGSRALAQILGRQGVEISHETRLADTLAAAGPGTTLLVTSHALLYDEHADRLAATGADLVLVEPGYLVERYSTSVSYSYAWGGGPTESEAQCSDADAQVAGSLEWSGAGYRSTDPAVTLCFADGDSHGMAVTTEEGRRITVLATSAPFTNEMLDVGGNAALALRLLGKNTSLVWFTPRSADLRDLDPAPSAGLGDLLPPWVGFVAIQLLVLVLFVALWRGRRLGPLVAEPLPVVVQSAETTRGRGRLYRRARSHGHAGAALRAASAARCSARLGLPRSAGAEAVIDAVSYASGRSTAEVAHPLYGPPPTSDTGLTHLARELDRLESEVHRP